MQSSTLVQFRRACPSDASALARLRFEFRAPRAATVETEDEFLERCTAWMEPRLIDASSWRAWVAETSDLLVGNVWMQVVEKLPNPGEEPELHAYVSNFFVRSEHRNLGAGSGLMKVVLDECSRLDVDSVLLWPTARSRSLYERLGFTNNGAVLSLDR
jgi:GNAT superfamily N-acetyltransferase